MFVCDRRLRYLPVGTGHACRLLVLLDGELAVTFDALKPVIMSPGDGIAFPVWEQCRLDWTAHNSRGQALLGYAQTSRGRRPRNMEMAKTAQVTPYVSNRAVGRVSEA